MISVNTPITAKTAFRFIILLGVISFFSDTVYEGARSITGPYLSLLHASGTILGAIAGLGELLAFVLRFFSGYLVDKTGRHWTLASIGYLCNIIAIPMLALAVNWQTAAALILLERVGKALRVPARDAMLSYASKKVGRGRGFGLHQVLDQMGGMLGPLLVTFVLLYEENYPLAFALLLIPALLTFLVLNYTRIAYKAPQTFEPEETSPSSHKKMPKLFWIYIAGLSFLAAGFVDFPLIAFHFHRAGLFPAVWIPITYVIAMGASALSAFFSGWLYDRFGAHVLIVSILLSSLFPAAVFLGNLTVALLGMICWGIGLGSQRAIMKAIIADFVPQSLRGKAFGYFNALYGIAWRVVPHPRHHDARRHEARRGRHDQPHACPRLPGGHPRPYRARAA